MPAFSSNRSTFAVAAAAAFVDALAPAAAPEVGRVVAAAPLLVDPDAVDADVPELPALELEFPEAAPVVGRDVGVAAAVEGLGVGFVVGVDAAVVGLGRVDAPVAPAVEPPLVVPCVAVCCGLVVAALPELPEDFVVVGLAAGADPGTDWIDTDDSDVADVAKDEVDGVGRFALLPAVELEFPAPPVLPGFAVGRLFAGFSAVEALTLPANTGSIAPTTTTATTVDSILRMSQV